MSERLISFKLAASICARIKASRILSIAASLPAAAASKSFGSMSLTKSTSTKSSEVPINPAIDFLKLLKPSEFSTTALSISDCAPTTSYNTTL